MILLDMLAGLWILMYHLCITFLTETMLDSRPSENWSGMIWMDLVGSPWVPWFPDAGRPASWRGCGRQVLDGFGVPIQCRSFFMFLHLYAMKWGMQTFCASGSILHDAQCACICLYKVFVCRGGVIIMMHQHCSWKRNVFHDFEQMILVPIRSY